MTIGVTEDGHIGCSPLRGLAPDNLNQIAFANFNLADAKAETWMHVACTYDQTEKKIHGYFFDGVNDHETFYFIQDENVGISKESEYSVHIGSTFNDNDASLHTAFREVRLWHSVRSKEQIMNNRHHSVDAITEIENGLVSYARLAEGTQQHFDEAQSAILGEHVQIETDDFWLDSVPGLVVCSISNFYVDGHCYTNPFRSVSIFFSLEQIYNADEDEE